MPLFLAMVADVATRDPATARAALAGLARYQAAPRPAPVTPMPVVATAGRAVLRRYGGAGTPVVLIPSLINPPAILDLSPDRSFARWLMSAGFDVHLIDWGAAPRDGGARHDLASHAELAARLIARFHGSAAVVGYCLGGTIAMGAVARARASRLALIATPWRFSGYQADARAAIAKLWAGAKEASARLGVLPMEVLQSLFWQLDPQRTVAKYAAFAAMPADAPDAARFVVMEDWANAGEPIPHPAAVALIERLFGDDDTGAGRWHVGGTVVDPHTIACPILDIVSRTDRIVPAAAASGAGERRVLDLGHVGMMAGGQAKAALWTPLAAWLAT